LETSGIASQTGVSERGNIAIKASEQVEIVPMGESNEFHFQKLPDSTALNIKVAHVRDNCCQPSCRDVTSLPFDPKRVYQRKVSEKKYVDRKWVTIKVEDRKVMGIYCNVCLSFSDIKSCFTDGFTKYSHVYERITDHEESKSHNSSVMALFHAQSEKDIETLINVEMVNDRKRAIQDNVLVLQRILAVIKFLGKQALPFRGHRYESMYTLGDRSVDHGNFLELILLISQFDVPLNNHIHKVIDASKKRHDRLERKGNGRSRGRGNLTTMLSKSTINKILLGILSSLKSKMVEEIGDRRFSVQMDSTQDTSAIDQETTVLRYVVGEEVKERLFSVQNVMDASASGIFQMLKGNLEGNGLKWKMLLANRLMVHQTCVVSLMVFKSLSKTPPRSLSIHGAMHMF
jgi:hypothetical protein